MSRRFVRCPHCSTPHDATRSACPSTGRPLALAKPSRSLHPGAPPPPRPSASSGLVGKTVGVKYVVRSVLGEGGTGTIFEAVHLALGGVVALKVLRPELARNEACVRRFRREARAARRVAHPNVCDVYDVGALDDGRPYLVMERLVGQTLADRIAAGGGLPIGDVIDILVQVLSALGAAHERGVIHRDLKPENVFLARRAGCAALVKLLDFGASKILRGASDDEDPDLTASGMVVGTPHYMSPEQARGDRRMDARVDLYACGVMLYEALTGRRPFTATHESALLRDVLSARPTPARELRAAISRELEAVVEKAMSRCRDDRHATAAELQRDLRALMLPPRREPLAALRAVMRPLRDDEYPTRLWQGSADDAAPTRAALTRAMDRAGRAPAPIQSEAPRAEALAEAPAAAARPTV